MSIFIEITLELQPSRRNGVYIAGPIELIGGILVAIGLFTRWTAFLSSGLMAFAY
ncbi:MAG: DoxX family membrane protein [Nitrospirae bacterium]|nr:DoxX family membrane protein [Nitrospirota bacterium]